MSDNNEVINNNVAITETTKTNKTNKTKPTKVKKEKNNGFNVPPKNRESTRLCIHLFNMIKEAKPELLEREDVRTAYNNLVDCFIKNQDMVISWHLTKTTKYSSIIPDEEYKNTNYGLPYVIKHQYRIDNSYTEKLKEVYNEIITSYRVLFELIKRDIVPYMEIKYHEINGKISIERYHKYMEGLENHIKHLEDTKVRIDKEIVEMRQRICEYAEKCVKLQQPPELTKFD